MSKPPTPLTPARLILGLLAIPAALVLAVLAVGIVVLLLFGESGMRSWFIGSAVGVGIATIYVIREVAKWPR